MYPAIVMANGVNTESDEVAVGAVSAQFANIVAMVAASYYLFISNTGCWIQQGANPTASAAPGSMFVPANTPIYVGGQTGAKLAVIQDALSGKASLTRVML